MAPDFFGVDAGGGSAAAHARWLVPSMSSKVSILS